MAERCCDLPVQVITLGEAVPTGPVVELHRCTRCQRRSYRHGDLPVTPTEAFAALSGTFRRTAPEAAPASRPSTPRRPATKRMAVQGALPKVDATPAGRGELEALLNGWTVLGS